MSGRKAKAARQQARASVPAVKSRSARPTAAWRSRRGGLIALAVVAIVVLSFVLPGLLGKKGNDSEMAVAKSHGVEAGTGLPRGSAVPGFSEQNLLTGAPITARSIYAHKTLLFFSEGVMCQACFEQIQGLQKVGDELAARGIQLVSITPDSPGELRQAADDYGITTPLISDSNRKMSEAFNTLGLGMHSNTPGHAFVLAYHGKVLWYRDYWLPPYQTMYVKPSRLLADLASA